MHLTSGGGGFLEMCGVCGMVVGVALRAADTFSTIHSRSEWRYSPANLCHSFPKKHKIIESILYNANIPSQLLFTCGISNAIYSRSHKTQRCEESHKAQLIANVIPAQHYSYPFYRIAYTVQLWHLAYPKKLIINIPLFFLFYFRTTLEEKCQLHYLKSWKLCTPSHLQYSSKFYVMLRFCF